MRLYNYWPADLPHSNWLMHTEEREAIVPNPPYDRLICPRCRQFSYDDVFALGFEDIKPIIRVKGDIFMSDDDLLCINTRFRELIEAKEFPGLKLKPLGKTGWSVVKVASRFKVRPEVYQVVRGPCSECGRPREVLGSVRHLGQFLAVPVAETFFTPECDQPKTRFMALLLTDGIVAAMKQSKIKGGALHEILDEGLYAKLTAAWQRGEKIKFPKGSRIVL